MNIGVDIIIACVSVLALIYIITYFCEAYPSGVRITFRKFKSLYAIAPDKWGLHFMSVSYATYTEDGHYSGLVMLHFSILETIPYELFRGRVEHEQEQQKANHALEETINCWQRDIDAYREKYCGGAK